MGTARLQLLVAGMLWVMCWSGRNANGQEMGTARLSLQVAGMLWVMCWSGQNANGQSIQLTPMSGVTALYPNNSIVTRTDIGIGAAALLCTTTYSPCCSSANQDTQWYFPDGSQVLITGETYYRTRSNSPRAVRLNRNPSAITTGIFRCTIPDASGVTQTMFVGIYDSNTGAPTATTLVYSETTRSLTCTSTGGPATTVTWRKDGAIIAINGTYQQTQVVTDTTTGEYETVLTIAQSVTDIFGTYSCTVGSTRGTSDAIEATVSSLQAVIMPGANPIAGQSYMFTCTVTVLGGLTGTPTVQWRGPDSSVPITSSGELTVSSTPPYTLTINPLRQSHNGQYTCQATIGSTIGSSSATLTVEAPSVSVMITSAGTAVVGQMYSLSCSISGAESLSPTSITYRWYNESSNPRSQVGTTSIYTFTRLRPYHAGQYTCEVMIASPFLSGDLGQSMTQGVALQIPTPTMLSVLHTEDPSTYAGRELTLACSIVLDSTLFLILGDLSVTSVWSGPGSQTLSTESRITVSPVSQPNEFFANFISTVTFNTLRTSDAGTYTCEATVAPRGSTAGTVTNGVESATVATPTIENPAIQLQLTSNTTRFPNVAPYNTFSLTCTATVPDRVISPKTFTWKRRIGSSTTGLTEVTDTSDSSTDLTQPTSTSVLTVRETTAGDYRYRCRADLSDLSVLNTADIYPISVTGPATPVQPQNLMHISVRHNRATVQWSVSYIAYTHESYTVNYGSAMGSLDMSATATQRGDNFTIPSQPFTFSAELTGLSPAMTYYYQVEARNSEGTTPSAVQQFTSTELPPTPPRMFRVTAVSASGLSFSWLEPAVPNGVVTRYELSCDPLLSGISPFEANPTRQDRMAVLTDLLPGVRYNCSIGARNGAGLSDRVYSDPTTNEITPTGTPLNFTITPGARNMTFNWSLPDPTKRNGVITGYSLSCVPQTGGNSISMQYTEAGTATLEGFTPATSYKCSIFAINSQGNGPATSMIMHTLIAPPGTAPQSVMLEYDKDSPEFVLFSWQPPDQQNGEITGYDIVCTPVSGIGEPVNIMTDNALNATVGMFTPATEYSCTITASTSAGTGPGNTVTVVTLPDAPENVTLTISPTNSTFQLLVTWTIDPPNGVNLRYTIYVTRVERGNTVLTYTSTNTQFDIPRGALDPGELVLVRVSASDDAGEGARSPEVIERTREEQPGSVGCPSRWTDMASAIQVNWTAPQKPNGIVLQYYLVLTNFSGTTVIASTSVNSNGTLIANFANTRLQDGVPYTIQIFAENSAGNGTVCNVTDFTNELEPPPPSGLTVTRVSDTVISVVWQPLSLLEAQGHIRYRVMVTSTTASKRKRQTTQGERMCTLMSPCLVPANESSVLVGGLDLDTNYRVTVSAINGEDEVGSTSAPEIATRVQPMTGTSVVGIVVGFVMVIVILVVIFAVVIGVLITRNKRYQLSTQEHTVRDQPVKWSAVAKSGDVDITITQCEAYGLAEFGHEYEEIPTSGTARQPPNPEYEIPTAQCPAYVPTSQQKERVEEGVYETV